MGKIVDSLNHISFGAVYGVAAVGYDDAVETIYDFSHCWYLLVY